MSEQGKQTVTVDLIKDQIIIDVLKERKSERWWRWIRRAGIAAGFTSVLVISMSTYVGERGGLFTPREQVAVIAIHGEIGEGKMASAAKVVPALRKAFESDKVRAVVLDIDSPGGQPQESERIYREMDRLKKEHKKPVVSVISAQGASAAYLIAIHTDKIVAGNYSMVGSIGALIQTWNFAKIADKVGVGRNTVTSGRYKDLLNPFREVTKDERQKVEELVHAMADEFIAEVVERRRHDPDFKDGNNDVFTGEVWSGGDALRLGLIDSIGTLEEVTQSYGYTVTSYGPGHSSGGLFSMVGFDSFAEGVAERVLQKMTGSGMEVR